MSMFIAAVMFIALLAVATAHFAWALGFTWPIRNEQLLAQTVVGTRGIQHMPPRLASFAVALLTLAFGVLALALADHDGGGPPLTLLGLVPGAILTARGLVGYTAWWAQKTPEPNFRLNDKRVYSPLCLFLGIGFFVLIILRLL